MAGRYGLEIRGAVAGDAPGLAELLAAAGRPTTAAAVAARLARLRDAGAAVLVAIEWGPPAGVAVTTHRPALEGDAPTCSLDLLLVAPDDRRRGVGRLLLKAAAQAARQAGGTELLLRVEEDGARGFALACGFAEAEGALMARALRRRGE